MKSSSLKNNVAMTAEINSVPNNTSSYKVVENIC
jgi:hypothetical protein